MCIIMVKPPGKHLLRRHLKAAFEANPDGAGFAWHSDNQVHIHKGWFGFRKFYKALRATERANENSTFVVHMRIGTSGGRNTENCHPFVLHHGVAFAHNGVMTGLGDHIRSDTKQFAEDVLDKLPDEFWTNETIMDKIEDCARCSSSKYVMLTYFGAYIIFNEKLGTWEDGCWYSNTSHKFARTWKKPKYKPPTNYTYAREQHDSTKCMICESTDPEIELGTTGLYKICNTCFKTCLDTMYLSCPECYQMVPLAPSVSIRKTQTCEFCNSEISAYEVWSQLSDFVKG